MKLFKIFASLFTLSSIWMGQLKAQTNPEAIYNKNIHGVRFHMYGDQLTMPVYNLTSGDRLELHFDDMEADVKNYYYTYQLCDYDWNPVILSPFDYTKGFTQMRITTYRYSSIAFTRYTHYQAILPESNSIPTKSGNYLLKVFLNGDTSKLAFTRRLLVLDRKSSISTQIVQPFLPQLFRTHQRLRFSVNIDGLNVFNPAQQVKVMVLQNYRWDNAQGGVPPTFIRGNTLEYNNENNFVFPGGKEWRWLDLRSLRLQSDRVEKADYKKDSTNIYVYPDVDRSSQRYLYYTDMNGLYQVETYETINPYWQGDYATTYFTYVTPNKAAYADKDIYLFGQLTDYAFTDATKMQFNADKGVYEANAFLKQGYYSYGYVLADKNDPTQRILIDDNNFETENSYTILVYYKAFTDQYDRLIGVAKINSRTDRPGISF